MDFIHVFIQPVFIEHQLCASYCTVTWSQVTNMHTQERLTGREEAHKQVIVTHEVNATREKLEIKRARVEAWKPAFTLGRWGSAQGRNWQGLCELLRGSRFKPPVLVTTMPLLKPALKINSMPSLLFALFLDIFPL